ncbi:hypothetical protein M8J76_005720 [Diaphorina citri]|nr:hypothetical protein M8J76_005720 [Diaphorina citri]
MTKARIYNSTTDNVSSSTCSIHSDHSYTQFHDCIKHRSSWTYRRRRRQRHRKLRRQCRNIKFSRLYRSALEENQKLKARIRELTGGEEGTSTKAIAANGDKVTAGSGTDAGLACLLLKPHRPARWIMANIEGF